MAKRSSLYPGSLDSNANWGTREGLEVDRQPGDRFTSDAWDLMEAAILAIETELGSDPAGAYADVNAWLTALQADLDGFPNELKNLVTAEIQQLENIGPTTISAAQWGYVGDMNQGISVGNVPAFLAYASAVQSNIAVNTAVTVIFGSEIFDIGGNFASNTFTAPVTGKYHFDVHLRINEIDTGATYYRIRLKTSNRDYSAAYDPNFSADLDLYSFNLSVIADMDAGDTAYVEIWQQGGVQQTDIYGDATDIVTWFSGALVG